MAEREPPKPPSAFSSAATRDWPAYYDAMTGKPPRETCSAALGMFEVEGLVARAMDEPPGSRPLAIDLGCGEGRDTAALLSSGWRVLAIDAHPEALRRIEARTDLVHTDMLELREEPFAELVLPRCRFVNASFSLPFCEPAFFDAVWTIIYHALAPGGRFAGQLFGDRDTWASLPDRTHHTAEQVRSLLSAYETEAFEEEEKDAADCHGNQKHWHVFHIVARKPETAADPFGSMSS